MIRVLVDLLRYDLAADGLGGAAVQREPQPASKKWFAGYRKIAIDNAGYWELFVELTQSVRAHLARKKRIDQRSPRGAVESPATQIDISGETSSRSSFRRSPAFVLSSSRLAM